MKFNNDLISILKNFSDINPNLVIESRTNVLRTAASPLVIYGEAVLEDQFDNDYDFGIYDLREFLSTIQMFENPEITFHKDYVEIEETGENATNQNVKYWSADTEILNKAPVPNKEFEDGPVKFVLTESLFKNIKRASSILKCPDIKFVGDNKNHLITATVCDLSDNTSNTYTINIDENYQGEDFEVKVKENKFMIIIGDYDCTLIANNKVLKLNHKTKDLMYLITTDVA